MVNVFLWWKGQLGMANLRNESRFHKKYTKTNMGGKIPKRGPKGLLIYGVNPSCTKKYTKTKIGPKGWLI